MKKQYLVIKTYAIFEPTVIKSFNNIMAAHEFCSALNKEYYNETNSTEQIYFVAMIQQKQSD
jgi:hypothetical protein